MRTAASWLLALMIVVPPTAAPAADYERLVAELRGGKTEVDYTALREAYAASPRYDPYGTAADGPARAMYAAVRQGDCAGVLPNAEAMLDAAYLAMDAHYFAGLCHDLAGRSAQANFHQTVVEGLARSILASGDGAAPATAYVVMSVAEEYAFLRLSGLEVKRQALVREGGHAYDRLEVVDAKTGAARTLFFNIDRPFARAPGGR